ncbi:MAG: hypothetical protein ACRD19_14955, partial [Terriglobia bacterium]
MRRIGWVRLGLLQSVPIVWEIALCGLVLFSGGVRGVAQTSADSPAHSAEELSAGTLDLAKAPTAQLLKVYAQLRALEGSNQSAVTENVTWKRDAATFTFKDGTLTFAAPVAGRVVAAVFTGDATFELDPPTPAERHQIARFTGQPNL